MPQAVRLLRSLVEVSFLLCSRLILVTSLSATLDRTSLYSDFMFSLLRKALRGFLLRDCAFLEGFSFLVA